MAFFALFAGGWYARALRNCVEYRDHTRPLPADGPATMVSPLAAPGGAKDTVRTCDAPEATSETLRMAQATRDSQLRLHVQDPFGGDGTCDVRRGSPRGSKPLHAGPGARVL